MELTIQDVAALARATNLEMSDEDAEEVTLRLEVILRKMEGISHPGLDAAVPLPFLPFEGICNEL
jgi:Asp-tRNA(Asn)/Glu-tRNA(Gln) amidotransferase C subunit